MVCRWTRHVNEWLLWAEERPDDAAAAAAAGAGAVSYTHLTLPTILLV